VVLGSGDKLVSGAVDPVEYRLDFLSGALCSCIAQPPLSDEMLKNIYSTGRQLTEAFGYPLDIEFAFSDGILFVLQARPITTLRLLES
jgi:hypothetical protein